MERYFDFAQTRVFNAMRFALVAILALAVVWLFDANAALATLMGCLALYLASTVSRDFVYMVAVSTWALIFVAIGCVWDKETMTLIAAIISVLSALTLLIFQGQTSWNRYQQSKSK